MTRTLLCFGDSNTHGTIAMEALGGIARFERDERWPGRLALQLGAQWHVVEEGHPGRTTVHDDPIEGPHRNGATVLPSLLESHRPIDLVVLMLGTNDLKPRFSLTSAEIALSAEKIVKMIQASDAGPMGQAPAILLVAPVPVIETGCLAPVFAGGAEKSAALAKLYKDVAARLGTFYFDAGSVAECDPIDGVHLSKDAHNAIADALFTLINREFP